MEKKADEINKRQVNDFNHIKIYCKNNMIKGNNKRKTLKKGEQEIGNDSTGKKISRDRRTAVVSECTFEARYREGWQSTATDHHCGDGD